MDFKNGREAHVGDPVIGKTYNRTGVQMGILVGITPGTDSCNCRVACIASANPKDAIVNNTTAMAHSENSVIVLTTIGVDYSACGDLYHADDAFAAVETVEGPSSPDADKATSS